MRPITFLPPAKKYLKKLTDKKLKQLYYNAIKEIRSDPEVGFLKKSDLAGIMGYDIKYKGVNYEIAYYIAENEEETVVIVMVGTRENFWEAVKKYINWY